MAKVNDLFSVAGKPVVVWLTRHADGTWNYKLEVEIHGAVAQVRMKNGIVVEMEAKAQKDDKTKDVTYSLVTKSSSEKATFTFRKLPNGKMAFVMVSELLYGDRFRMVWEMLAVGGMELYFLEELKEASK